MTTEPNKRHHDDLADIWTLSEPTAADPVLVVCPRCSRQAGVCPHGESVRLICSSCAHTQASTTQSRTLEWEADNPTDGYFRCKLWLQVDRAGHSLWAFNIRHLDLLESYVTSQLRSRNQGEDGWRNSSVLSRLPRWLSSSKNREKITKGLKQLREKLI